MPDVEIDALRTMLTARPRPASLAERRQRLDGLGTQYAMPADVRVTAAQNRRDRFLRGKVWVGSSMLIRDGHSKQAN